MPSRENIADQLQPLARRMGPVSRRFPVVRVLADLKGGDLDRAVELARTEALKWIQRRSGQLPEQAWKGGDFENTDSVASSSGIHFRKDSAYFWAGRLYDPDKNVAGRTWDTELLVARDIEKNIARFGLHLNVATREEFADILPSVPGVVWQLIDTVGLERNGRDVKHVPTLVKNEEDFSEFMNLLQDSRRRRPLYAISLGEQENDPATALVDSKKLARRTAGLAHVYVLTGQSSFWLSDAIGRKMSVFLRAVRTYRAGFDPDKDEPYDHPLALPDKIQNWPGEGPDGFIAKLVRNAASESLRQVSPERDVPSFNTIKNAALHMRRQEISQQEVDPDSFKLLEEELALANLALEEQKNETSGWNSVAEGEERARLAVESERDSLRAQIFHLRTHIEKIEIDSGKRASDAVDTPETFDELTEWAERNLPGRIHITGRASRAAKNANYQDVKLVYDCLIMLGREFRDSRTRGGLEALDQKKQRLGVEISRSFAGSGAGQFGDTYFVRHNGRNRELNMHVKKGNARDSRNCLRIYFFWDEDDQMVVVGSLPSHLENSAS